MKNAPSYKAILNKLKATPLGVQDYFSHLPSLIQSYPYEVSLAYIFFRTELAQNRTLYCGVVKLHHAHTEVAQNAINSQHLTRDGFLDLYKKIFDEALPQEISNKLKKAEAIRDRVVHGKAPIDSEMREAMFDVLDYAEHMNAHLQLKVGFQPFGDLRGFKGRGIPLDKKTTRWLLKGIGFSIA